MTKLQLKLAQKYEENGYNAALNFWAENQGEIKSLSEQERDDLKKMMLRYCKINKDESSALSISQDRNSPQNKEIMSFLFELARIYNDGKTVDKNTVKSERLYEMLLEGGDSDDLYKLGEMYRTGDGVVRNESKAAECFKKSAVGGNKLAAYRLGEMYMLGYGVEKSRTEAENWYNAANTEKNVYSNTISRMVIPDGITNISKSAFEGFETLKSVAIPNSVNRIEQKAFSGCTALENVTFSNEKISIEKDAFEFCDALEEESKRKIGSKENSFIVLVTGGVFQDGRNNSWKDFEIGRYLVTQSLYDYVMGNNSNTGFRTFGRANDNSFKSLFGKLFEKNMEHLEERTGFESLFEEMLEKNKINNFPVVNVSWYDAIKFCNKLSAMENLKQCYIEEGYNNVVCDFSQNGYRLPTEKEWEFAAQGGIYTKNFKYAGSNKLSNVAWHNGNSNRKLHIVGQLAPNELGLYDMSGNVWEWCWDNWNGSSNRILKGGSCVCQSATISDCRQQNPSYGESFIGFRVVRTIGKFDKAQAPKNKIIEMVERMIPSDIY